MYIALYICCTFLHGIAKLPVFNRGPPLAETLDYCEAKTGLPTREIMVVKHYAVLGWLGATPG
jgi:hypothetical protein